MATLVDLYRQDLETLTEEMNILEEKNCFLEEEILRLQENIGLLEEQIENLTLERSKDRSRLKDLKAENDRIAQLLKKERGG